MSDGGFEFLDYRSKVETTKGGDPTDILGARMNPKLTTEVELSTVKDTYTCDPKELDEYLVGNVVAISNPFYEFELESDELPLYIITSPYKVRNLDYHKYKMIPLNSDANYVRIHGNKEEAEATLLTGTGRAQPASVYPVPDIIVAKACGFSEDILSRRM